MRIQLQNIFEKAAILQTGDYYISFTSGCCPNIYLTLYGKNDVCSFESRYRVSMPESFVGSVHRIYDDASFLKVAKEYKGEFLRGLEKHYYDCHKIRAQWLVDGLFKAIEARLTYPVKEAVKPAAEPVEDDIPF